MRCGFTGATAPVADESAQQWEHEREAQPEGGDQPHALQEPQPDEGNSPMREAFLSFWGCSILVLDVFGRRAVAVDGLFEGSLFFCFRMFVFRFVLR